MADHGKFIISVDLELMWGVRDKMNIKEYGENVKGVHNALPRLLETFRGHKIRATFAAVGLLVFETKEELLKSMPDTLPGYANENLSPYNGYFDLVGRNTKEDPYHFGSHLIKQILRYPEQEVGTHTFSHYYCLEKGQTIEAFKADILQAQKVAQDKFGLHLTSLVFPRNQFNNDYLEVCKELGIICFRGNEHSWIYAARNMEEESLFRRALKLADTYINLSGNNCYNDQYLKSKFPVDIPASRFLRPYSPLLKSLESLRLKRIKSGMSYAAKKNLTYHLWWHPHNFGINQDENFSFLEKVLAHYDDLNNQYNFQSYTMSALAKGILTNEH
ncbi:polysaccharide deacetylase family protein [Panacibacter ginsenosidivorans]|uniref:Polysaccharide deacetylase family protein n=1 Tax=Panacibacter ginsenosidivorans TaxID=1813871 RepID=A0A5B8V6P0_9BACT|nr:polysaccharide deacetylase family protein [Panacibacter ginsenosidivorans]QEC67084.1 polysaccharide deacetylase family protein [Panacibacter ginsenosidivorans]